MRRPEMLPQTLLIADLHLDPARPAALELFARFLSERAAAVEALYILGDLFEVWVGDDDDTPAYREVIARLRGVADGGVAVAVLPGNRDFLLGERFAAEAGCRLLTDPTRVELYGVTTLLAHGDRYCTADTEFQNFRRETRTPHWRREFLAKPLALRRAEAAEYRRRSRRATAAKPSTISAIDPLMVAQELREQGAARLIHGHIHRAGHHREGGIERLVVADWSEVEGSVAVCDGDGCRLERFR